MLFAGFEIRERQLSVNRLYVSERVDFVGDVDHVGILEASHNVGDRIRLTNICQKLVAEALAFRCARYQSGDIHKLHRGGNVPLGVDQGGNLALTWVGDGYNAGIGLNRTKRKVLRIDTRLSQCIE